MKLSVTLGLLVGGQLALTVLLQSLVMVVLGAGRHTDAYVAAQTLPLVALSILGTALQNVWQPKLAVIQGADWSHALRVALGHATIVFTVVATLLALAAPVLTRLIFLGFDPQQLQLTVRLTEILLITLLFNGCATVLAAAGRTKHRFVTVETVPFIVLVGTLLILPTALRQFGIEAAAWLLAGRSVLNFVALWLLLACPVPHFRFDPLRSRATAHLWPLLAGALVYKLGPLVDRFWSSQAGAGSMTLYNLAQTGATGAASVLDRAIGAPVLPGLARNWAAGEYALLRTSYRYALLRIWSIVAIGAAALLIGKAPILTLLETLLKLSADQATLFFQLSLALVGFFGVASSGNIPFAAFYAAGDTRTPVIVGVVGFVAGTVAKSLAFAYSGLVAMAAFTSAYYVANLLVVLFLLERKIGKHDS